MWRFFRKKIETRLAAEGKAFLKISKSGQRLQRYLFDTCVLTPERIVFEAEPKLSGGLERRVEPPEFLKGAARFIDVEDVEAGDEEAAEAFWQEQERKTEEEAKTKSRAFDPVSAIEGQMHRELKDGERKRLAEESILPPDLLLHFDDGSEVEVGDLWMWGERYDEMTCAHPLEPERNGGSNAGIFCWNGGKQPLIFCQAHGGQKFYLSKKPIFVNAGALYEAVLDAQEALGVLGTIYNFNDALVRASKEGSEWVIRPLKTETTRCLLAQIRAFVKRRPKGAVPIDPPDKVVKAVLERPEKFKRIRGTSRVPVYSGGRLVFDGEAEGVLVSAPEFEVEPDFGAARRGLDLLRRHVLSGFEFASPADEAAALCLLLTVACRPSFKTCPMFGIDASKPGSGKSYLASIARALAGLPPGTTTTMPSSEEELEKKLGALLTNGDSVVVMDNVSHFVGGDVLNSLLTAGEVITRRLGESSLIRMDATLTTLIATGNGLLARADQNRRMVWVRLEPKVVDPSKRQFKENPLKWVIEHRKEVLKACWDICVYGRSYQGHRSEELRSNPGSASFEAWAEWCVTPLRVLGLPSPLETREVYESLDSITEAKNGLVVQLWELQKKRAIKGGNGCRGFEARELAHMAKNGEIDLSGVVVRDITPRNVGNALKQMRGWRVEYDDGVFVLEAHGYANSKKSKKWVVRFERNATVQSDNVVELRCAGESVETDEANLEGGLVFDA